MLDLYYIYLQFQLFLYNFYTLLHYNILYICHYILLYNLFQNFLFSLHFYLFLNYLINHNSFFSKKLLLMNFLYFLLLYSHKSINSLISLFLHIYKNPFRETLSMYCFNLSISPNVAEHNNIFSALDFCNASIYTLALSLFSNI